MAQVLRVGACAQNVGLHLKGQCVSICGVRTHGAEVAAYCVSAGALTMWYLHMCWRSLCVWSLSLCVARVGVCSCVCTHPCVWCLH